MAYYLTKIRGDVRYAQLHLINILMLLAHKTFRVKKYWNKIFSCPISATYYLLCAVMSTHLEIEETRNCAETRHPRGSVLLHNFEFSMHSLLGERVLYFLLVVVYKSAQNAFGSKFSSNTHRKSRGEGEGIQWIFR
mgnify:CR=1 FL=1